MKNPIDLKRDPVAIELGYIIMEWAAIDDQLDQFIAELGHIDDKAIADILCGNIELRGKIQITKGLSFVRKRSDDWLSAIVKVLDHIDNELRPKRNLFAHAHWFHFKRRSGAPTLITKRTKLTKPQSFKLLELETRQMHDYNLSDLRKFRSQLTYAWVDLMFLFWYAMREDNYPADNSEEQPLSFQQYLQAVGYKIRSIRATPKPSPRKKSPRKATSPK
jgi:hypothetical protein